MAEAEANDTSATSKGHTTIVVDCGSCTCKAGYAGDDAPRVVFPTVVGRRRSPGIVIPSPEERNGQDPYTFVGDEALAKRGILSLNYPIDRGVVDCWDNMEKIFSHVFYNELRVFPEEHLVLLTEPIQNPKANRERLTQVMFESFQVVALFVINQPTLSLYGTGRTTGCVIESGGGATQIVPIFEGYCIPHSVAHLGIGGRDLSDYLCKLLCETYGTLKYTGGVDIIRDIKETMCYVAEDFEEELQRVAQGSVAEKNYEIITNGIIIPVNREIFSCPEVLFQPNLVGLDNIDGISDQTYESIKKCDPDILDDLLSNITLSGGSTMFPGMIKRISKDIRTLAPANKVPLVKIWAKPGRKYSSWIGGSILASLDVFQSMCICMEDYNEFGPSIVHEKCNI
mmetsp:Transcript_55524/g.166467  ORF Transcript_55524/g.166467 Transcript_55524/m.166467 type:complete len:398 (-) Transcript_55524:4-1197(-)